MRDERLCITDAILDQLRLLKAQGADAEQMITYLADAGVPKGGAMIALRLSEVMGFREAKLAVHVSQAYEYRRAADEAFENSVFEALDQMKAMDAKEATHPGTSAAA